MRRNQATNRILQSVARSLVLEQIPFSFEIESIRVDDSEMKKFGISKTSKEADRALLDALRRHDFDLDYSVWLPIDRYKGSQII
jgi:hypothetical protein